jgi:hypothetical protein
MRNECDVAVVKHDYQTKYPVKYFGQANKNYPRKNWSSVMLWNCGNHPNHVLTPDYISEKSSEFLHRFQWLKDERIQELPKEWNHLVDEYDHNDEAKLLHFTLAIPAVSSYEDCDHSQEWWQEFHRSIDVDEKR